MHAMTRAVGALGAAVLMVSGASVAYADDGPIVVDRSAFGWVTTEVTDAGSPARAERKRPQRLKAAPICTQTKSKTAGGYATAEQFASGAPPGGGPGGWVTRRCSDGSLDTAWVPVVERTLVETPERLAQRATNRLSLPLPQPRFDPSRPSSAGPSTLVNIPTWFWVDGWKPVHQQTRAGGVWAEVVATPVEATWFPGDGTAPVHCIGPGRPWSSDAFDRAACRHTYLRSSAAQRGLAYLARVTVVWKVTWRGSGGRGGALPLMERQMSFPVAVAERQTVVTVGGGA